MQKTKLRAKILHSTNFLIQTSLGTSKESYSHNNIQSMNQAKKAEPLEMNSLSLVFLSFKRSKTHPPDGNPQTQTTTTNRKRT